MTITAVAYLPVAGTVKLRYQLNGTALAGYRGGVLLSPNSSLLSLNALGTITIRTYLSTGNTPNAPQDAMVVGASAAQAQLLAGKGAPVQMELLSTAPFDQVEVEFGSALSLGTAINVHYAYGIGANTAAQVTGLTSNSKGAAIGQYGVAGCTDKVTNPSYTVDSDPTNYATFSSLASVNCPAQLTVGLNGTAPGTYKAGFVIGKDNTLLDASVLGHLVLKTYKNGVLQETASGSSLLGLSVLPDSKSLVSFQATMPFDAVSIERSDAVAALDNLQLYYGVGVASTSPPQIISSFADPSTHYQAYSNGTACVNCSVSSPANAASDPNSAATINVPLGVNNYSTLRLDLNGAGSAGNRAGMMIGNNSLLDATALSRVTLITYDDNGNVLETASGSSLLTLNVLPNGRQTVSFNTTKNFSKVGIQIGGLASAVSNTSVYYAFSDSSNGSLAIVTPTGPLPVSLISFAARRAATSGAAILSWTTASEANSASFVVERTANPATGFVAIGQVAAAGSSATVRNYSLTDNEAASQTGILYYRLRQLDADGQAHLSAVVVLAANSAKAGFALYPNPAPATAQRVTLATSTDLSAGYTVELYSLMGQLLHSRVVGSEGATAPPTVATAGLAAGIYHVVLRNAAGQQLASQRLQIAD
ncbi:T9SS type A sorting domain-containing protein [Hymenobacter sp. BRD128]|uniref:T9SS type A sorting domain-containing protein n=1 Tax=Hymenobacter sp. BRD128 TaxID=2675878 RepID=UPI001563EFE5|nr:T9SS type A sorting domain-containing protein [Hymenobacter sp. BRD128]QKG58264.1 T9SS type A sorting domain-containing protein [Hymenobacter sp. BRD128]